MDTQEKDAAQKERARMIRKHKLNIEIPGTPPQTQEEMESDMSSSESNLQEEVSLAMQEYLEKKQGLLKTAIEAAVQSILMENPKLLKPFVHDYMEENGPGIIATATSKSLVATKKKCQDQFEQWLKEKEDLSEIKTKPSKKRKFI